MLISSYFILFAAAFIEGPMVALATGFLVHLGYFSFVPAYTVMLFGDLVPDTIYYYIGRFGNKKAIIERYGKYLKISEGHIKSLEYVWHNHGKKTMFIGKIAYGFSIPVLVSAGLAQLPLKKFWAYSIPVTLFQYGVLMTVGYYFGKSYQALIGRYFQYAQLILASLVLIFLVIFYVTKKLFANYAQKNIFKE